MTYSCYPCQLKARYAIKASKIDVVFNWQLVQKENVIYELQLKA